MRSIIHSPLIRKSTLYDFTLACGTCSGMNILEEVCIRKVSISRNHWMTFKFEIPRSCSAAGSYPIYLYRRLF